jgi:hypothetical protein
MVILKEPFLGWWSNYEGCLKSSWTGNSVLLLCLPPHNSSALLPVHKLFRWPSYNRVGGRAGRGEGGGVRLLEIWIVIVA